MKLITVEKIIVHVATHYESDKTLNGYLFTGPVPYSRLSISPLNEPHSLGLSAPPWFRLDMTCGFSVHPGSSSPLRAQGTSCNTHGSLRRDS